MNDLIVLLGYGAIFTIWVLVPLLPAILIYRLFPQTNTQTQWKISGIVLKAGGASGFYFAIFALGYLKIVDPAVEIVKNWQRPYWEVTARLKFLDADQKVVDAKSSEDQLQVLPLSYRFKKIGDRLYLATLHFSELQGDVPDYVTLHFPEGEGFLNLKELKAKNMSLSSKTIDLTKLEPIAISPIRTEARAQSTSPGISQQLTHQLEADAPR